MKHIYLYFVDVIEYTEMSWKPITQPAADSLPVISSKKASLQLLVEKEKQMGPVVGILNWFI